MGGEAVGPVEEDSGLLGEPMVVVVSEVKLIQVPRALPASRAPHPAVIALQLFLSLPFLLCLFGSLHLVREGKQGELQDPELAAREGRDGAHTLLTGLLPRTQRPGARTTSLSYR